jgi:hypothetical protein
MICLLVMATAIRCGFGCRTWLIVAGDVAMALIRAHSMGRVMRGTQIGKNYVQPGPWSCLSAVF